MKKVVMWISLLLVVSMLGALCLSGCASKTPAGNKTESSSSVASADAAESKVVEPITRQDAEGLVQVRIEDGQAFIRLNPERWDELYEAELEELSQMFGNMEMSDFQDLSFFAPIERTDECLIIDACIGPVPNFSDWALYGFPVPIAMLLREDGRVEAVAADPFVSVYSSEGMLLPFLESVKTLAVDVSSGDGRGGTSIYATCADGLRYDLAYLFPHTVSDVFGNDWSCDVETADPGQPPLRMRLELLEVGAATFTITGATGPIAEYEGSFEFVLAEGQEYQPPTLVLDLELVWCTDSAIQDRGDIKGAYYYSLGVQDLHLYLWRSFGDALFVDEGGTPMEEYYLSGYGEDGEAFDTPLDTDFGTLREGDWVTELRPATQYSDAYQGTLRFLDETRVEFEISADDYGVIDAYSGTYSIVPDGSDPEGNRRLMIFDLSLEWTVVEGDGVSDDELFPRREIKGAYIAEMTIHPGLFLWLSDGDCLYNNQYSNLDGPKTDYSFFLSI